MDIAFEQVSFRHARGTPFESAALNGISLHIPSGQFVAVMGRTGSGKSTLAQMINGLILPQEGEVRVGAYRMAGHYRTNLRELREHVGYVFQYPEHQLTEETVLHDIGYSLRKRGMAEHVIRTRVMETMEQVGLSSDRLTDCSPYRLSRGQMRRVALAGALIGQPSILVMDELTSGLDPAGRSGLLALVRSLHEKKKLTIVYVTHRLEEALEHADRIVAMHGGKVHADLSPAEAPHRLRELREAGLQDTPLLKLIDRLEPVLPERGNVECIVKERQLITYLAQMLKGVE
ncbi:ATP-binding cassette domain-containing protein [Paenibacillus alkalitolerans]|uniref:ATP-binding cassette domain-containing protein n=1 Tax=Paenibacillus alkalitolerans TaxID=2799335 RepID=UPI0018F4148E|nr:ATP-binding cassette domain-containing protein [Paenibacillus alkalitolerans]